MKRKAKAGDAVECVTKSDYTDGISIGSRYIVNGVKRQHETTYYRILGDDDRGHWLLWSLFALSANQPEAAP